MKKLLSLVFVFVCISIASAKEYQPMLTDGKAWKWEIKNSMHGDYTYIIAVNGDTIVRGQACKKIYYGKASDPSDVESLADRCTAAYEEDGKVYVDTYGDRFTKILDFSMQVGDSLYNKNLTLTNDDYVEVNGKKVRRLKFKWYDWDTSSFVWVEGIGTNKDEIFVQLSFPTNGYQGARMLECYDNGKLIYTADDFLKDWDTDGITLHTTEKTTDGATYDITGKPINAPHKGDIYIKEGKKRIMK